jgi:hypothetical protein
MSRILILILILGVYLGVTVALINVNTVSGQNMTGTETGGNFTTDTIVTNGTTINMTNASTPMITNVT